MLLIGIITYPILRVAKNSSDEKLKSNANWFISGLFYLCFMGIVVGLVGPWTSLFINHEPFSWYIFIFT